MCMIVTLAARRFTLHVIESVDDACITIDERLLGTLRRIGDVDAVGEARIKGLFKEARAPQPDAEGKDQFESILGAVERSVKSGGLPEGQNKTVLRALILAQLERCARRLKTDQALLAPHCIEANAETFKLICSLLRAHPVSSAEQVSGGTAEEAISFSGYVPLALIRLLTINLRQAARQAARQTHRLELDAELLTDLRSVLLSLVEDSASRGTDSGLICRAQEEAVAALRAGTPVLFNDPAELVGLLDVMLQKRSEHVASPSEVQFMAMLLSYLAKPPVIWRVLTLSEDDTEAQEDEVAIKPEGNAACMRLFHCLLGHLKQHCMARISQTCKAGDEPSNVIPSACTDVLATAWHLQYACWTSATTNKSAALQVFKKISLAHSTFCHTFIRKELIWFAASPRMSSPSFECFF